MCRLKTWFLTAPTNPSNCKLPTKRTSVYFWQSRTVFVLHLSSNALANFSFFGEFNRHSLIRICIFNVWESSSEDAATAGQSKVVFALVCALHSTHNIEFIIYMEIRTWCGVSNSIFSTFYSFLFGADRVVVCEKLSQIVQKSCKKKNKRNGEAEFDLRWCGWCNLPELDENEWQESTSHCTPFASALNYNYLPPLMKRKLHWSSLHLFELTVVCAQNVI